MSVRHVYPTSELVHIWAHDTSVDLRNSHGNVYSVGDTIYSYGHHFPMAKRKEINGNVVFLINPDSYSSTTSGHQSAVRSACSGNGELIDLPVHLWSSVYWRISGADIREYFNKEIERVMCDANNNRMGYWRRNNAINAADVYTTHYNTLKRLFHFRVRNSVTTYVEPDLIESKRKQNERDDARAERWKEQQARWNEEQKKCAAERELKEIELRKTIPQRIEAWRNGESVDTSYFPDTQLMRIKDGYVETTMHARVEVSDAAKFLTFDIQKVKERPGLRHDINIGPYHGVIGTDKELIIGCHHFTWEEVGKLSDKLRWSP